MASRAGSKARFASVASIVLAGTLPFTAPACSAIQPEVGELLPACVDADSNPDPNAKVNFKTQIRPIMNGDVPGPKPCAACHYETRGSKEGLLASGLNLETLLTLKAGGRETRDAIVVPRKPCSSVIVQKLRGTFSGARMPKGGPYWSPEQVQLMIDWIAEGAEGANTD